jgi:hypothetical protein
MSLITPPEWVSPRTARDFTTISERTLSRLRLGYTEKGVTKPPILIPGKHWRRITPSPNSRVQYNIAELNKFITESFSRGAAGLEVAE